MLYHTAQFEDIGAKALQARALLDFLSQSVPTENNAYGIMLRNELDLLRQQSDSYLLSDHLKNENEPVYFHRFAEQAAENELQYLAEAEFSSMPTSNFAPEVADTLRRISNDIIRTEQYMDFVRNRAFRQTLLCHKDAKLNRNLDWKSMTHFRFATPAKTTAQENQLQNNEQIQFSLPNGVTLNTTNPLIKLAFSHLSNIWPRSASFEELVSAAASKLTAAEKGTRQMQEQVLGADLLIAYAAGVLVVRGTEPKLVLESSERPAVHEFTRHQAKTGIRITNQLHEPVDADVFVRNVLILLDGTRELSAILDELEKLVEQGALNVQKDGRQLAKGQELRDTLKVVAEESLAKIAQAGLLIA
jgi:methyltransferase-like protein